MVASPSATIPLGDGPSAADVDQASSVLKAVALDRPESLSALDGIRFTPAAAEAAAQLLGSGTTGDLQWAATYVYATSGDDPEPLRQIATAASASPTVRVMAAAGLVGRGDVAGFDPLIAALGTSDPMEGAEPVGATWEFAADVLARYTSSGLGPSITASDEERVASQARWLAWLDANRATLRFDVPTESWLTP